MKNKTAVEWLQLKLNSVKPTDFCSIEKIKVWVELAKGIEREQIINAYDSGTFYLKGENYYKKTFEDESGI